MMTLRQIRDAYKRVEPGKSGSLKRRAQLQQRAKEQAAKMQYKGSRGSR